VVKTRRASSDYQRADQHEMDPEYSMATDDRDDLAFRHAISQLEPLIPSIYFAQSSR
jgi:hypothetical protein